MKKQEKGITLIALVVTIIVLLILAGVAISLSIGNNGLFNRAVNTVNNKEFTFSKSKDVQDENGVDRQLYDILYENYQDDFKIYFTRFC